MDKSSHTRHTRDAYDRLAPVWSATTDDGPYNGSLERPALQALIPRPLAGTAVLDAGCGAGALCEWLLEEGVTVTGVDLSPAMVEQARLRNSDRGEFLVTDLAEPLPFDPKSFDGVTCSLALHYLQDWDVALASFARVLRPSGWAVVSTDHPFGEPFPDQPGGYFDRVLVNDTWQKGGIEVTQHFWRRPLGAAAEAFADAGFTIDRVVEPRPSRAALAQYPAELQHAANNPVFIIYRLRLA